MGTMTIRVTSSATNEAGTAFGQQFDANSPSFFDIHISNSTDPNLPNGVYDGYCLNPVAPIDISPASYSATSTAARITGVIARATGASQPSRPMRSGTSNAAAAIATADPGSATIAAHQGIPKR